MNRQAKNRAIRFMAAPLDPNFTIAEIYTENFIQSAK